MNMNYNLERFITAQEYDYDRALQEIKEGYKRSHWMWYIFPQIKGLGFSYMAKMYEINGLEEAILYLENDVLRSRLLEITTALLQCKNNDIEEIMGYPDDLKLCSCMTLFEIASKEMEQKDEKYKVFGEVLNKFYAGKRDKKTIEIIYQNRGIL